MYNYIAFEGVIGAGKTTLANEYSKYSESLLLLESFEDNEFLENFYKDSDKYSFLVECRFLVNRILHCQEFLKNCSKHSKIISDFTFIKTDIFASNNLDKNQLKLFFDIKKLCLDNMILPDIVIYLSRKSNSLLYNIKNRNRNYENNITIQYLEDLNNKYLEYFEKKKIKTVVLNADKFFEISKDIKIDIINDILQKKYIKGINYYD